jgi:hypothetical protein
MRTLFLRLMHHFHWHHMPHRWGQLRETESTPEFADCTYGRCNFRVRIGLQGQQIQTEPSETLQQ